MYGKDYIEYDGYGLKEVRCMRCDSPVKKRGIVEHILPDGGKVNVYAVKTMSNFSPVPFTLSDGSFTNILMCRDCNKKYTDNGEERKGMEKQVRRGLELEAIGKGRSREEIGAIRKRAEKIKIIKIHTFGG